MSKVKMKIGHVYLVWNCEKCHAISVADPDRFGPDPDPTSENRSDPDSDPDPVKTGSESGFI